MISLAVAWVLVTAIKQSDSELEFSPAIFVITGLIDALIVIIALSIIFS